MQKFQLHFHNSQLVSSRLKLTNWLLGFVVKLICIPIKEFRETIGMRGSQIIACPATLKPGWGSECNCWRDPPYPFVSMYSPEWTSSFQTESRARARLLLLLRPCICYWIHVLCVCASWEYIFSLTSAWTRGKVEAAASPFSGCWIQIISFVLSVPLILLYPLSSLNAILFIAHLLRTMKSSYVHEHVTDCTKI